MRVGWDILEGRKLVNSRTETNIISKHEESLRNTGMKRLYYGKRKTISLLINGILTYGINVSAFLVIGYLLFKGQITVGSGVASLGYIESFSQPLTEIMNNLDGTAFRKRNKAEIPGRNRQK